jgi:hypothetical protein
MEDLIGRLETLEHHVQTLEQQNGSALRRLYWWRRLACSLALLTVFSLPLTLGAAQDERRGGRLQDDQKETLKGLLHRFLAVEGKLAHVTSVIGPEGFPELVITGANLRIVNGMDSTESTNGLGNLIVGYNEPRADNPTPRSKGRTFVRVRTTWWSESGTISHASGGWWSANPTRSLATSPQSAGGPPTGPAASFLPSVGGNTTQPAAAWRRSVVGVSTRPAATTRRSAVGLATSPSATFLPSAGERATRPPAPFLPSAGGPQPSHRRHCVGQRRRGKHGQRQIFFSQRRSESRGN